MHEDAVHNKIKGKCEEQLTVKEVGEQVEHVDAQATEFLHEQSLLQYKNFQNHQSRRESAGYPDANLKQKRKIKGKWSKQLTVEILEKSENSWNMLMLSSQSL